MNVPFVKALRGAAARGVPLVFARTGDQVDCLSRIVAEYTVGRDASDDERKRARPVVVHDPCRGLTGANEAGADVVAKILDGVEASLFADPSTAIAALRIVPGRTIVVCLSADRWLVEPRPALAALLLRNAWKSSGSVLVCLGSTYSVASELGADLVVLDDPAPSADERTTIIRRTATEAKLELSPSVEASLLTFTRGLTAFAAEQTCALAVTKAGFDLAVAEKAWREQIDATPGLRVLTDRPDPKSVAGLAGWMRHVERLSKGRQPPEAIVFIDEVEKSLAGASGASADSSGASQQVLGRMLSEMEGTGAQGSIFLGPAGTGKTLSATAAGAALGIPTIVFNPSDCKGSLVGETERNASRALATLRALAGRAYWIATCNGIVNLPPELLRRFTDGVWFFDLPSSDELAAIWAVHLASRGFKAEDRWTSDAGWTGADVRNVCRSAWNSNVTIEEVASTHVPSSRASAAVIDSLRRAAHNAYRSASTTGAYRMPTTPEEQRPAGRSFDLEDAPTKRAEVVGVVVAVSDEPQMPKKGSN